MRIGSWGIIAAAVLLGFILRNCDPGAVALPATVGGSGSADPGIETPADAFVYDVATRFNETLVASIDAIDSALTAVLAGDVAVAVFAIDKIKELQPIEKWCAISLLCSSIVSCAVGYAVGFSPGSGRDGVPPRRLIPDLYARQSAAISEAVESVIAAAASNLRVRYVKRALAVSAIGLMLLGGVLVTLARLTGDVVK